MLKLSVIVLLILKSFFSYGQQEEIYLNDDFQFISKEEFNKKSSDPFGYNLRFQSDTTFVNIKVIREKEGRISSELLDSIKENLSSLSKQEITSKDVLLINYYPGDHPSTTNGYKINFKKMYGKYHRKIEKLKNVKQFSIYKSKENIREYGSKIEWLPDSKNLITSNFYPIHYPNGGYIIINNDGTYLCQRGEYCYSENLIQQIKNFANIAD